MTDKKMPEQPAVAEKPVEKKSVVKPLVKTAADQIWDEIKDLRIEMFALPEQRVHMYCKPVAIEPSKLFLLVSAGAVLTALELVVAPKYVVEKMDRFVVVSPAPNPFKK
jgi:hypothetical protein